jgi:hypothetical protein
MGDVAGTALSKGISEEEKLVAELELLGIRYLSRQTVYQAAEVRSAMILLSDLVRQPSARVRLAVIATLLSHPEFADSVPAALDHLTPPKQLVLKLLYAAACLSQRQYAEQLRPFAAGGWRWLPELFTAELGLAAGGTSAERLTVLGDAHRRLTGIAANWTGTYRNTAEQLLRR